MMDSDRWETTMTLQRNATSSSSNEKDEKEEDGSSSKEKKKTNNHDNNISSRYGSDMEQAFAMQRATAAAASKQKDYRPESSSNSGSRKTAATSRSSSSRRLLTLNDIRLGMTGLEKAGDLARQGELTEAMRIYELSLELLIRYLQSPDSAESIVSLEYDRSFVETLVKIALSDAESVKATLQARAAKNVAQQQQQPSAESTREKDDSHGSGGGKNSYFSGLVDLLSSACKVTSPMKSTDDDSAAKTSITQKPAPPPCATTTTTATGPSVRTRSKSQQQIQSRPAATRKVATTRRTAPPSLAATRGEASSSSSSAARRLPAAASTTVVALESSSADNELRQIILNDFLVPTHTLQKTTWLDIAGLENVKQSLQETAILPLVRPDLFTGLRRPQNILLYGPPGTGKTMLVRAVAHESGSCLFCCSASSLTSKWMGEAEKLVKTLFQVAAQAAPSLIFMDEVDALLSSRKSEGEHEASRRLKTEFMIQMEGISSSQGDSNNNASHVLVLACTNCPWDVDSAVLRRFPRRIHVPLPDAPARAGMLEHLLQKAGKHSVTARQMSSLVNRLDGFSCSDISAIASEASFGPIRDLDIQSVRAIHASKVRPISMQDFETAMKNATKTVTEAQLRRYQEWQQEQGASTT